MWYYHAFSSESVSTNTYTFYFPDTNHSNTNHITDTYYFSDTYVSYSSYNPSDTNHPNTNIDAFSYTITWYRGM